MTTDPSASIWRYSLDLAAGLGTQGVEVVLATLGARPDAVQRREARVLGNVQLVESGYQLEWMPEPWDDVSASGEWLLRLAARHHVDIVHCNHLAHGHLPWEAPVLVVAHACVASWWEAVRGEQAPAMWDHYRQQVGLSLRAANAVIAPSHAMLASLQRHYGPLCDVSVIRHARRPMPHATGRKEPIILGAGRVWDDAKNLAALGRVAPAVPWPIHIAGSVNSPTGAVAQVPGATLLGPLTPRGMAAWLRRASIFALPSRYEPSSLTVLDAARAGCALVLGDIPSLRELWDGAALFVAPDDDAAIAQALTTLAADDDQRSALARAARQRAAGFSYDEFVREYLLAYRVLRGGYERLYDGVREVPRPMPAALVRAAG